MGTHDAGIMVSSIVLLYCINEQERDRRYLTVLPARFFFEDGETSGKKETFKECLYTLSIKIPECVMMCI